MTFVFLNPLLTLIYFVFGFLLRPPKVKSDKPGGNLRTVLISLGSAIAIASIGIVLVLFEWPFTPDKSEPVVISNESQKNKTEEQKNLNRQKASFALSQGESGGFRVYIGSIDARNNIQTLSSTSAESGAKASIRNIMIICQSPNELLDRSMREFQKSLVKLPYVDKVAYYPFGTWPEPGVHLPDVYITVSMPDVIEKTFIRSRYFKAIIKWTAGSSVYAGTSHSDHSHTLEMISFEIESQLEHESKMFGIESSQAKYKLAANDICNEMNNSICKQFENLLDKYGRMSESPQILYGTYHEPPELSFLKTDNVKQLISGYGLLKNNHTVWRFAGKRDINRALKAYWDELKTLGWGQENLGENFLQMQKENEHIYIFCQRQRDSKAGTIFWSESEKMSSEAALIADYKSDFTDDQMQRAMDALLDGDVEIKTLLVFEKYFRTPMQLERLEAIIEQNPVHTLDGYLMLTRYWVDHGRRDKGRESLLRARVMQRTEKSHNIRTEEIKSLAGKLGDESLAEGPVDEEIFLQMGFINTARLKEPLEIEKAINEPVLLYSSLSDGELQTFALRIISSQESRYLMPYNLLIVESRNGSLSSSENSGKIQSDGVWEVETSIDAFTSESKSIRIQVKCLDNGNFLFTIIPQQ